MMAARRKAKAPAAPAAPAAPELGPAIFVEGHMIVGGKRSGKTTELIRIAHDCGGTIVCSSFNRSREIQNYADDLGLPIPMPISYHEFIHGNYDPMGVRSVLIDDLDSCIAYMSRVPIRAMTLTIEMDATGAPAPSSSSNEVDQEG